MATMNASGVRIFSASTINALEDAVNAFLQGDGTTYEPKKVLVHSPSFFESGGTFYIVICFIRVN